MDKGLKKGDDLSEVYYQKALIYLMMFRDLRSEAESRDKQGERDLSGSVSDEATETGVSPEKTDGSQSSGKLAEIMKNLTENLEKAAAMDEMLKKLLKEGEIKDFDPVKDHPQYEEFRKRL